ncbi:SMODS domain-containing nucleotidyltransferase [Shouchella lehensis]|uniref:Nucleotidyltransferase n=1 Tax=Shouchella lehensis G1 TaxID=1246626 RepID=A0A060LPD5_9BACI|nr:hypothetical protein [Shouchella lehensis]AIC93176.1 hypothetical protein BleG1_0568 [Shouchella lehensis G1]
MAKIPTYFKDFLKDIRLTKNQISDLIKGHKTLCDRLNADEDLSDQIVSIFLQGSYRRATAVRPKDGKRSDVDVVVVTNLDKEQVTPKEAHDLFEPFLEKHYKGKYRVQGRSIGIELSYVDLDLVVTSAPSEIQKEMLQNNGVITNYNLEDLDNWIYKSEQFDSDSKPESLVYFEKFVQASWKTEPLFIANREANKWDPTNPLEQIQWTWDKNKSCNSHYVNVVKALKWWRRVSDLGGNYPKSYPLEHLIGVCCPDGIDSIASGVTETLETIVTDHPTKPVLPDHGVPEHDVFERLTEEEYETFYEKVKEAANLAREALDADSVNESATKWRELFGNKFPEPPKPAKTESSSFTERVNKTHIGGNRFA